MQKKQTSKQALEEMREFLRDEIKYLERDERSKTMNQERIFELKARYNQINKTLEQKENDK